MDIQYLAQNIMAVIGGGALIFSVLAFITSLFVEVVKSTGMAENAPMQLITYIIGMVITEISLLAVNGTGYLGSKWYYYIMAIPAGIMVAQVAMNGWDNLKAIWTKVKHESVE